MEIPVVLCLATLSSRMEWKLQWPTRMLGPAQPPEPDQEEKAKTFFHTVRKRFDVIAKERKIILPEHGFWEVSMVINGHIPPHEQPKIFSKS